MADWFISDHHFGHKNIMGYEARPFESMAACEDYMIEKHNELVEREDRVFMLGDFSFYPKDITRGIVDELHGELHLIKGNHDSHSNKWYRDVGFIEAYEFPIIYERFFILSHEPVYLPKSSPYINVHGHLHGISLASNHHVNVSVELIAYTPQPKAWFTSAVNNVDADVVNEFMDGVDKNRHKD
jgi:calcineurin-like phosphoesterase family protein